MTLPLVADNDRPFRFIQSMQLAQSRDAENFVAASLRVLVVDDQRDFTIVIVEANSCEGSVICWGSELLPIFTCHFLPRTFRPSGAAGIFRYPIGCAITFS